MKADILSVTLPRSSHKCCHANLVRLSPWLAGIDGCFPRWFSIAVVGAMMQLPPHASQWTTGCSFTLLKLAHCGLLCGFHNSVTATGRWTETMLQFSLTYIKSPLKSAHCITLWRIWSLMHHEWAKWHFKEALHDQSVSLFLLFHNFHNDGLTSGGNSWSILLFSFTQIPKALSPSLFKASVQHIQHCLQFIRLVT